MKSDSRNGAGDPGELKDPCGGQGWLLGGSHFQVEISGIRSHITMYSFIPQIPFFFFFFSALFLSEFVAGHTVENETFLNFVLVTHKGWCYKEKRR